MELIYQKIKKNLEFLKINNNSVLIALSGGKDSMTLFNLLLELQKEFNLKIYAAYVNHNLRDEESKKEEDFVLSYLKEKSVAFFNYAVEKNIWKNLKNESIEMHARKIRYEFFRKICNDNKIDYIATAHNFNDKIETFFLNLLRGSGLETLNSIPFKNKNIIRPLLNITRNEIEEYIETNNILFFEDSSNKKNIYKRNIVRNEVLPMIEKIKPNSFKSFEHIFTFLKEENLFMNSIVKKFLKKITIYKTSRFFCIDKKGYNKLPIIIQKNILKKSLKIISYPVKPNLIMFRELTGKKSKYLYKKGNFVSLNKNNYLWFINIIKNNPDPKNKSLEIKDLPFSFENYSITLSPSNNSDIKKTLSFSYQNIKFPITIRTLKYEDEIYISDKTKKNIKSILSDNSIPKALYELVIVIEDSDKNIIAFIIDNFFRVSYNYYIIENEKEIINVDRIKKYDR